jgi:hypothetical protein
MRHRGGEKILDNKWLNVNEEIEYEKIIAI